ncbi:MAG: H-NS histone family protein [Idiomarina sp.]|nr:H-NS histone family protein [Idiomarina sp.]
MSEFTDILTHARRLNAATKELTVAELSEVASKLAGIIEQRKEDEAEQERALAAKQLEVARIRKEIEAAGLSPEDILGGAVSSTKTASKKQARTPRPAKYKYIDANGQQKTWTGQGRTPKAIQEALDAGRSLNEFAL